MLWYVLVLFSKNEYLPKVTLSWLVQCNLVKCSVRRETKTDRQHLFEEEICLGFFIQHSWESECSLHLFFHYIDRKCAVLRYVLLSGCKILVVSPSPTVNCIFSHCPTCLTQFVRKDSLLPRVTGSAKWRCRYYDTHCCNEFNLLFVIVAGSLLKRKVFLITTDLVSSSSASHFLSSIKVIMVIVVVTV